MAARNSRSHGVHLRKTMHETIIALEPQDDKYQ